MVPGVFSVGEATKVPAAMASYQIIVSPGIAVAVAVRVCIGDNSHCVTSPPETGAVGAGLIVSVTAVLVKEGQIPLSASA